MVNPEQLQELLFQLPAPIPLLEVERGTDEKSRPIREALAEIRRGIEDRDAFLSRVMENLIESAEAGKDLRSKSVGDGMPIRGDGRIQVHASRYGVSLTLAPELPEPVLLPKDPGFPGEIVTEVGGGAYTFKEKVLTDGTTWADLTGGRTGTCYESNDVAGVPVGTHIKICIEYDTGGTLRYVFNSSIPVPAGTADGQLLAWDQTTDKAWEVIVPDGTWLDVDLATGTLKHIGPGAEVYKQDPGFCLVLLGWSLDAVGHVRWIKTDQGTAGPCA